jgi:hypothetical protein
MEGNIHVHLQCDTRMRPVLSEYGVPNLVMVDIFENISKLFLQGWHTNDVVVDEVDQLYYHLLIPRSIRGRSQKEDSFDRTHDIILKGFNLNVLLFLCRCGSEVGRHDEFGKFWDRQIVDMKSSEKLFGY